MQTGFLHTSHIDADLGLLPPQPDQLPSKPEPGQPLQCGPPCALTPWPVIGPAMAALNPKHPAIFFIPASWPSNPTEVRCMGFRGLLSKWVLLISCLLSLASAPSTLEIFRAETGSSVAQKTLPDLSQSLVSRADGYVWVTSLQDRGMH
jgi:hypothetical protein